MYALPIYDSIICFGDSLTQRASQPGGYVAQLQNLYQRRFDVVSRGFGGYTSRQAIGLCPRLFTPESNAQGTSAKLAIIWFGTNDSIAPEYSQHVPLEEYKRNMTAVLDYFPSIDIILVTPATVVPGIFAGHEDDKSMVQYGKALFEIAEKLKAQRKSKKDIGKVSVVDMHTAFISAAEKTEGGVAALLTEDGLHINQAGYEVVYESIRGAIMKELPHLEPTTKPFTFPSWSDLDLSLDETGQAKQLEPRR